MREKKREREQRENNTSALVKRSTLREGNEASKGKEEQTGVPVDTAAAGSKHVHSAWADNQTHGVCCLH